MNSNSSANGSSDSSGLLGSDNIGGFGYGIGVSIGILLLITTITLASYYCTRTHSSSSSSTTSSTTSRRPRHQQNVAEESATDIEVGLDETTLLSYPKMQYSRAKQLPNKETTAISCSICLADYKDADMLRLLPDCGHFFHLKCVDAWLRLHPTCPLCRTSPLPTPLPTPLAEVVPLAGQV